MIILLSVLAVVFEDEFKTIKSWRFSFWDVTFHQCPKCGGKFRCQVDPTGKHKKLHNEDSSQKEGMIVPKKLV